MGNGWPRLPNESTWSVSRLLIPAALQAQGPNVSVPPGYLVTVQALETNAALVNVAPSAADLGSADTRVPLRPSQSLPLRVDNLNDIFIGGALNDGVRLIIGLLGAGAVGGPDDLPLPGNPIARSAFLSTNSIVFVDLASWTVAAGRVGDLHEVSFVGSDLANTEFRLSIAGVEQFTGLRILSALSLPFRGNRLAAASVVLIQVRSINAAVTITANGSISGAER